MLRIKTATECYKILKYEIESVALRTSLPFLKQLHWLPVSYRIKFKLSTLTYRPLSTQQPSYLASLLHLSNIPKQLRSSISQLIVPKTKLNLGKRAFSVAAHMVWNELPISLKTSETIPIFRKNSTCIYSKLHFHHKCSVVPRSDTDFCMSLFTIMFNDSVLMRLWAQVPEDIGAIEVN